MNNIKKTIALISTTILMLLILSFIPTFEVFGLEIKNIDILADIKQSDSKEEIESEKDTLKKENKKKEIEKKIIELKCPEGKTCIEDYASNPKEGMGLFYKALDRKKTKGNYIRIAVFGDSFIEGDIFTSDLRELLQDRYGGSGVGYVNMTSNVSGFRRSVRHNFGGWTSFAEVNKAGFNKANQGIDCKYFIANSNSYVELSGQNKYGKHLESCNVSSIICSPKNDISLTAQINKEEKETIKLSGGDNVKMATIERDNISSIKWSIPSSPNSVFYGVTMDGDRGIVLDNFSLRGSTGLSLSTIPLSKLKDFNKIRPYDLIILEYGLNVVEKNRKNYTSYIKGLKKTIQMMKEAFPKASILLLGVADRGYKTPSGEIDTMPGVLHMIEHQQTLAAEEGIAFWNMFEAMGGRGSMYKLATSKPTMANKDYTHINFNGGKFFGDLLFEALMHGKKNYDKNHK